MSTARGRLTRNAITPQSAENLLPRVERGKFINSRFVKCHNKPEKAEQTIDAAERRDRYARNAEHRGDEKRAELKSRENSNTASPVGEIVFHSSVRFHGAPSDLSTMLREGEFTRQSHGSLRRSNINKFSRFLFFFVPKRRPRQK